MVFNKIYCVLFVLRIYLSWSSFLIEIFIFRFLFFFFFYLSSLFSVCLNDCVLYISVVCKCTLRENTSVCYIRSQGTVLFSMLCFQSRNLYNRFFTVFFFVFFFEFPTWQYVTTLYSLSLRLILQICYKNIMSFYEKRLAMIIASTFIVVVN